MFRHLHVAALLVFVPLLADGAHAEPSELPGEVDPEVKAGVDAIITRATGGPPVRVVIEELDLEHLRRQGEDPERVRLSLDWARFGRDLMFTEVPDLFRDRVTQENVAYYWSQFGEHGCIIDYALILAAPGMLYPYRPMHQIEGFRERFPTDYNMALKGAELQARAFMEDRDLLAHYHRVLMWSHLVYHRPSAHHQRVDQMAQTVKELFEDDDDDTYWLAARKVILLVYATGRDDLLDVPTPEGHDLIMMMDEVFEIWHQWYKGSIPWLTANPETLRWELADRIQLDQRLRLPGMPMPEQPCDDWDDDVPVPDPWTVYAHY